jgi:hypothetical protein
VAQDEKVQYSVMPLLLPLLEPYRNYKSHSNPVKFQISSTKLFTRLNNSMICATILDPLIAKFTLLQSFRRQFNWAGKSQIPTTNDQNLHLIRNAMHHDSIPKPAGHDAITNNSRRTTCLEI